MKRVTINIQHKDHTTCTELKTLLHAIPAPNIMVMPK